MNKFLWRWVVLLAWLACHQVSFGLGLGLPVTRAVLGDTYKVSVPVRLDNGEDLASECVKAEVFFGEDKLPASLVSVSLVNPHRGTFQRGDFSVQVQTVSLVNEPVVTVSISVGCSARITRRFVTLVDPPAVDIPKMNNAANHAAEPIAANEVRAALRAGVPDSVVDPISKRASAMGGGVASFKLSASHAESVSASPSSKTKKSEQSAPSPASKQKPAPPRLVLDPVAMETQVTPGLQLSPVLAALPQDNASPDIEQKRRAAAAVWKAMNVSPEEAARDRQRLENVEERLANLALESEKASQALGRVQEHLQSKGTSNDWLLYALVGTVVGLVVYIVWRERSMRQLQTFHQHWMASQMAQDFSDDEREDDPFEPTSIPSELGNDAQSGVGLQGSQDAPQRATAPAMVDVLLPTAPGALIGPTFTESDSAVRLRDVSVDELIDLDQQVEFFMVLGQEESAIDVLESFIRVSGASTPMPFLKLLELYRQAGLRADYERTRMNFNLQFNAHAPLWESDPSHGHALEDYPGVVERIQALWREPQKAMGVIERSLMRQDAESYTFDLPAYRELFLLYLVLKDLLAHPAADVPLVSQKFDVELDDSASPLMATLPMKTLPDLAPILSLDLELGENGLVLPPHDEARNH